MNQVPIPKVFISYYHEDDQEYKNRLVQALDSKAIDKSVSPQDIHDENLPLDEIRRRIRDNHIADATVTIVLIGPCTGSASTWTGRYLPASFTGATIQGAGFWVYCCLHTPIFAKGRQTGIPV